VGVRLAISVVALPRLRGNRPTTHPPRGGRP
jgi:hypothetical protein